MKKNRLNNKGFSLVELIIVIAIMAVLIGTLAPQYLKHARNARISTDITNAERIANAISVGIADGQVPFPSTTTTYDEAAAVAWGIDNFSAFPDSALTPGTADWVVILDPTEIAKITLNGKQIWPDPTEYRN